MTESAFFAHRVFEVTEDWTTRRCMTEAELHEQDWSCQQMQVSVYREEKPTTVPMLTWSLPGQVDKREAKAKRMSEMGRKYGFKKSRV